MRGARFLIGWLITGLAVSGPALAQNGWWSVPVSETVGRFVEDAGWILPPVSDGGRAILLKQRGSGLSLVDLAPDSGPIDPVGQIYVQRLRFSIPLLFHGETYLVGETSDEPRQIAIGKPGGAVVTLAPGPYYFEGHAVAAENTAMILWSEASSCGGRTCYSIRFVLIDADLKVIAGPTTLAATDIDPRSGYQLSPNAISTGKGFAVTWRGSEPDDAYLAVVSESGTVRYERSLKLDRLDGGVALASDGSRLLLCWNAGGEILMSVVLLDEGISSPASSPLEAFSATGTPAATWTGSAYSVAWSEHEQTGSAPCGYSPPTSRLAFGTLTRDGTPIDMTSYVSAGSWNGAPFLAAVNGRAIAIWRAGSCRGSHAESRWVAAALPDGVPAVVGGFVELPSQRHPAISSDGHHALIAWEEEVGPLSRGDPRVFASSIAPPGIPRFDREPVATFRAGAQTDPVISFNGDRFLVAWIEQNGLERSIRARFVHPLDGPEGAILRIADLVGVVEDEYHNQLNHTYLASTYVDGAHRLFWQDGDYSRVNTTLMTADVTSNGIVGGVSILEEPRLSASGIDATATPGGALIAWSSGSPRDTRLFTGSEENDFAGHMIYAGSAWEGITRPRIVPMGPNRLVTWLYSSGYSPYLTLMATTDSGALPVRLPATCYCPLSYDVIRDGDVARLYWTVYGELYSSTIDSALEWTEPNRLFFAEEVAATRHSLGIVLVTGTSVDPDTARLYVHFPTQPSPPRRRGVRR